MARISELHYSNAYARSSGVSEFLEVSLSPSENPADFTVSFYQANGNVGIEVRLDDPWVQVSVDPDNGEIVYVISADFFNIRLTDPDGGGSNNYEAYALTNTSTNEVVDFYDIGGGTQNITANNGAAAGATSDNLPVLVGPNATTTTLQFNQPNPDVLTYGTVNPGDSGLACFVAGTMIDTASGERPVEMIKPGDLVMTRDDGLQPVRWIGSKTVRGHGRLAPVRIAAGAYGTNRDILVSPQHRILVSGWEVELLFGEPEVLVPAKSLIDGQSVSWAPQDIVRFVHILFDAHQIVSTGGLASESFYPGQLALSGLEDETAHELFALFPELRDTPECYGAPARAIHSGPQATLLRRA
ncbi:Hint domain-containing protein [Falsiruegeria litorea]|uniref:Hint domain-containing protein n=1 Tax=Falsiruegeria litorea TaxID=1280831 RepID=UPI000A26BA61|nr:Hint domain-containing protein [Falsiruegeria litorea]